MPKPIDKMQKNHFLCNYLGKFEIFLRHQKLTHTVNLNKADRKERLCQTYEVTSDTLATNGAPCSTNTPSKL